MPLLLVGNIGCTKAAQCYFIRIYRALSSLFLHCNVVTERLWTPQTQTSIRSLCFTVGLTRFESPSAVAFYVKTFRAVYHALEFLLSYMHWIYNLPSNFHMWYEHFHYYSYTTAYFLSMDDGNLLKSLSVVACQPFQIYTQVQIIVRLTVTLFNSRRPPLRGVVVCPVSWTLSGAHANTIILWQMTKWNYLIVLY